MYKNFSAQGLGISGRQSELIELGLTYAFGGLDIDMVETYRRVTRSDFDNAARFLRAANIKVGGFDVPVDLDADDDAFAAQMGHLHPSAEAASKLGATICSIIVPAATDRLPYHEFFETITRRLNQMAEVLGGQNLRLGVGFDAGAELTEGKEFAFVNNVEGFLPLVKGLGDNTGFVIDTFSWFAGGGTMEQLKAVSVDQIVSVRLSGIADDIEGAAKSSDRILPAQSDAIDFEGLLSHLKEGGYVGPITPCAHPSRVRFGSRENVSNKAQEALDALYSAVGLPVPLRPMDTIADIPIDFVME